jgi:hypothetical protein
MKMHRFSSSNCAWIARQSLVGGVLVMLFAGAVQPAGAGPGRTEIGTPPLFFHANPDAAKGAFPFVARGQDCNVLIAPTEAVLVLARRADDSDAALRERVVLDRDLSGATRSVRFRLAGANPRAQVSGLEPLPGRANYLIGNDPSAWRAGVPLYTRVQVDDVYPGIRLAYYANERRLEYDFLLEPGADPGVISFCIEGANKVRVNAAGELVMRTGREEIRQPRPVVYQDVNGLQKPVKGGYRLTGRNTVGFRLDSYDRSLPLVIDPVLEFSSYLGGKKLDIGWGIALDGAGNIYVAGETLSTDLQGTNYTATNGVAYPKYRGGTRAFGDAFVARFNAVTYQLDYLTYLGGRKDDAALALAVDTSGQVYLTGFTDSTDFPLTTNSAFRTALTGSTRNALRLYPVDAFVTKLDTNGSSVLYSTLLGGTRRDAGFGIAAGDDGIAYVTGFTESTNVRVTSGTNFTEYLTNCFTFTPNAFQTNAAGRADAFMSIINTLDPTTNSLVYSTCLGGTNADYGMGIAPDGSGGAFVAGYTTSRDFPTFNAFVIGGVTCDNLNTQTNRSSATDAFVSRISTNGLHFSSYLGGSNSDAGVHIAVDTLGDAYVTGYTYSKNFPTNVITDPPSSGTNFTSHAFVTKLGPDGGTNVYYSTEFGSSRTGQGMGIAVDTNFNAYVTGFCTWTNFFTTDTNSLADTNFYADLRTTNNLARKSRTLNRAFVAVLGPEGTNFLKALYLGGSGNDQANGIAVDPAGHAVYVVGQTASKDFPGTNAVQTILGGGRKPKGTDAFVEKIQLP